MGDVITIAANLSTRGFERGSHALRQAINSLSRSVTQFGRNSARAATSVIGNFKRMLPMILGVGSAFGVISKAVSSFMAQNEELSSKMNSIWTALGNLIAPIMEQIINWITTAVSYFLEFLRLLGVTGKTASQLSQKANKSTQELKKTLAGFDELNILQDNNTNDKNKDAHLDDIKPSDWMKKLADLLKNKMWDEAADMIIEKMNKLIQTFKEKAYELGDKIGEYLGAALHIIGRVIDEVDWRGLGEGLANLINGIFNNPNMKGEDLGKILAGKFTIAFKILTAFLENFDSATIGKYFSDVITGAFDSMDRAIQQANPAKMGQNIANFFNNIDWNGIAVSVSTFLNDAWDWAFTALHNFLTNIKAKDIGASIKTFIENIDWNGIKEDLKQLLKDVWDVAIEFLRGLIAGDLEEEPKFIQRIRELGDELIKIAGAISDAIGPLWNEVLKPFIEWVYDNIIDGILQTLTELLQTVRGDIEAFTSYLNGETTFGEFITNLSAVTLTITGIGTAIGAIKIGEFVLKVESWVNSLLGLSQAATTASAAAETAAASATSAGTAAGTAAAGIGALGTGLVVAGAAAAAYGIYVWDGKLKTEYAQKAFEEAGGSAEGMASKMNELAETASHYEECLYDTTGYTQEFGWSAQESSYAAEAYSEMLVLLAEQLGLTTAQLQEQITAANGDVTQIEALKNSTSGLASSNNETANSQQKLNNVLDETAEHITGAADSANEAADGFVIANQKMQEAANNTDTEADSAYTNVETNVTEKSGNAADAVSTDSQSMETETEQAFSKIDTTVEQKMTSVENRMEQSWSNIVQKTVQKTTEMVGIVEQKYQEMTNRVRSAVDSMYVQVNSRFTHMSQQVIGITNQMASGVVGGVNNMMSSAYSIINNIASQIEDRMAQMAQAAQNAANNAIESAQSARNAINSIGSGMGDSGEQWGQDMTNSFYNSTVAAAPKIGQAAGRIAATVASFLHFSEPDVGPLSNFHTFAPDMMKMFEDGILDGKRDVVSAAASVADGVNNEFGKASEGLEEFGDNLAALSNIRGNVRFRTPGVVGGGVVPYSVSDASANAESVHSGYQSVMDQNDRIMEILGRILDAIMEGKVIAIDKYKFGELLVKTLSNEARARGQSLL